jgi:hypothetical protein
MRHLEKICRKIKCCKIPFSPEAYMDMQGPGLLLSSLIPPRQDKKLGELKKSCKEVQHTQPSQPIYPQHLGSTKGVQKSMYILPGALSALPL